MPPHFLDASEIILHFAMCYELNRLRLLVCLSKRRHATFPVVKATHALRRWEFQQIEGGVSQGVAISE
jgi:hypothetical protein